MGFLVVDSCLLLCSNFSYGPVNNYYDYHSDGFIQESLQNFKDITCEDPWFNEEGNKMMQWIQDTLEEWDKDEKIIWKASVQHHPMFGKWYDDFSHIVRDYLPILMDHRFDLYLNGHEHDLEYATYPYDQYPETITENFGAYDGFKCENDVEHIFKPESLDSYQESEL